MCCITIETDVLIANFFGSPECCGAFRTNGAELEKIEKCARVLANNLPGYVFYDMSKKKINEFVGENNEYVLNGDKMYFRGTDINRDRYNDVYCTSISRKISEIVDGFFRCHLYDKEIKILMPVQA